MSINDFIKFIGKHPLASVLALASVPLATFLWGLLHKRGRSSEPPWKYGYSVLVYLACIPGMLSAVLVCYSLFFTHSNLLNANALAYFLPLLTMALTLVMIRGRADFASLPGFGRLSGLMILIAISFALALVIDRTRIFLGFFGSIDRLFILVGIIFGLLQTALWLAFGRRKKKE
jgi:hypothetical protein